MVDHERGADRLPALRAAGAARRAPARALAADRDRRAHVVDRLRHQHADGLDLVDRRVGGVAAARCGIEQHVAFDGAGKARGDCSWRDCRGCGERGPMAGACPRAPKVRSMRLRARRRSPHVRRRLGTSRGAIAMNPLDPQHSGRHFLQIPGPTNVPDRVLRAIDAADDRPSRPRVRRARQDGLRRHEEGVQDRRRGRHLSGVGNGRVGGGARQHALARRPRADGRDRPFRGAVEASSPSGSGSSSSSCRATGGTASSPAAIEARLARGSRSTRSRRCASCTTRPRPASRAASPTCARPSIAPGIRRCSWSTRSRRSPRSTIATTSGASTSPSRGSQKGLMLPPGLSFNAISAKALAAAKTREAAALVLGLERDARDQSERLLSRTRRRPTCSTGSPRRSTCCSPRGSTRCSRATTGSPRRRAARSAPGGSRSCAPIPRCTARR